MNKLVPTDCAPGPAFDEWATELKELCGAYKRQIWAIGEKLNEGEDRFGETYVQAIQATGLAEQTLKNYKWVASRIDSSRRRDKLSFAAHMEVAPLSPDQQDAVLATAEACEWRSKEIRARIKASETIGADAFVPSFDPARHIPPPQTKPDDVEDAKLVEENAVGEPEVIDGEAVEVTQDAADEPFDRVGDMQARWAHLTPAECCAFFLWSTEAMGPLLSHSEKTKALEVVDQVETEVLQPEREQFGGAGAEDGNRERSVPSDGHGREAGGTSIPRKAHEQTRCTASEDVTARRDGQPNSEEVTTLSPPAAPALEESPEIPEHMDLRSSKEPAGA